MSVQTFRITEWTAAFAVADAHVWIDGNTIRVFTGADKPAPIPPEPRLIAEDKAVAAIKRIAPATTDRQARDAIDAERVTLGVEAEALEG